MTSSAAPWGRPSEGADARGGTDWSAWHRHYDDPDSSLSRRRRVVQDRIRSFLDRRSGELRVVSACAGDGRDLLEVLAGDPRSERVTAVLVEADESLAERARSFASSNSRSYPAMSTDIPRSSAMIRVRSMGKP